MHDRRFKADIEKLRAPGRVALLEVERVVALCLENLDIKKVLDVGTGSGIFAEAFAARKLEVTGIDANPEMIKAVQRLLPAVHFQEAVAEHIPYSDATFDLVFLGHLLHETDDRLQALSEARRVARLRVAILEWPYQDEEIGPPLAHRLKPEEITALAQQAGFRKIEKLPLAHMDFYRLEI